MTEFLPEIVLVVGIWMIINGVLHDVFVLTRHNGPYTRDLLRLLMDGHVLITCGLIQVLAYPGLQERASWATALAILASGSLFVYCVMIFPFLKSIFTMFLNLACILLLLISLL
jgi:uncharacterized membrane protein YobD (UPF0266 family)